MTAAEKADERFLESRIDRLERFFELAAAHGIDFFDRLVGVANGVEQVLSLRGEKLESVFGFLVFLDGHHVDGANRIDLFTQLAVLVFPNLELSRRQRLE